MSALWVCLYFAILVALVWNDIRTGLLPDKLTLGGTLFGIILGALFPSMQGFNGHLEAFSQSLLGAATGFGAGWLICEAGKKLFGNKVITSPEGISFELFAAGEKVQLIVEEDVCDFEAIFYRNSDRISFEDVHVVFETTIPVEPTEVSNIAISHDTLWLDQFQLPLEAVRKLKGRCRVMRTPREAMGFGLVKMMAFVGAFFGWQGTLTIFVVAFALCLAVILLFSLSSRFAPQPNLIQMSPFVAVSSLGYLAYLYYFVKI